MPYEIDWGMDERVVYLRCWDAVTMPEITQIGEKLRMMMQDGDTPIHIITNYTDVTHIPFSLNHARAAIEIEPLDRVGWIVTVTKNNRMRFINTILLQISSMWMRQLPTLDSALEFLQCVDESLQT